MNSTTVTLHNLSTGYQRKGRIHTVARGLEASLHSGELTCLLGANGSGKSTLLRTLSAFLPPLEGHIDIMDRPLQSYTHNQLARLIGVVLTERPDVRNLNVEELIGLGRSPYTGFWGGLEIGDRRIVNESIERVHIGHLRNRPVHSLSDGERQKVMIAKALAQETPIVFLDEPTAFLDFPSKVEMMRLLHDLAHQLNKTIFLSTHDLELALQMADTLWLMDKELGVTTGTPEDLSLDGSLERYFSCDGIVFDPYSGLFRLQPQTTRHIGVPGEGICTGMVRKALLRNGFSTTKTNDLPHISIDESRTPAVYSLHTDDGRIQTARSVGALLALLKADDSVQNSARAEQP